MSAPQPAHGQPRMGYVSVPDGEGGSRLEWRLLPPEPAKKGKKAKAPPDPLKANPEASAQMLKQFIERIERLEEEKAGIADDIRDVKSEAKAVGFDVRQIMAIVALRRIDPNDRAEANAILETYMDALGLVA